SLLAGGRAVRVGHRVPAVHRRLRGGDPQEHHRGEDLLAVVLQGGHPGRGGVRPDARPGEGAGQALPDRVGHAVGHRQAPRRVRLHAHLAAPGELPAAGVPRRAARGREEGLPPRVRARRAGRRGGALAAAHRAGRARSDAGAPVTPRTARGRLQGGRGQGGGPARAAAGAGLAGDHRPDDVPGAAGAAGGSGEDAGGWRGRRARAERGRVARRGGAAGARGAEERVERGGAGAGDPRGVVEVPVSGMPRVKLVLEYDGTEFVGWQVQPNGRSVQAAVEGALAELLGEPVKVAAAGRTDSGVHALGQVAAFSTARVLPMKAYAVGLNGHLPADVAVVAAEEVPEAFDPRRWSLGKRYRYRISNRGGRSPLRRRTHWELFAPLDVEAMREGARALLGRHDFSAFRAADCEAPHAVREVREVSIAGEAGGEVALEV